MQNKAQCEGKLLCGNDTRATAVPAQPRRARPHSVSGTQLDSQPALRQVRLFSKGTQEEQRPAGTSRERPYKHVWLRQAESPARLPQQLVPIVNLLDAEPQGSNRQRHEAASSRWAPREAGLSSTESASRRQRGEDPHADCPGEGLSQLQYARVSLLGLCSESTEAFPGPIARIRHCCDCREPRPVKSGIGFSPDSALCSLWAS